MSVFLDWEKAKPHILRGLEYSKKTHTIDDVALMVGAGILKIWLGEKSALLTEFIQTPRMKILNVFIAGGDDLDDMLKLENSLLGYAKENGCGEIRETGRRGWLKVLPGAQELGVALYREVPA